MTDHSDRRGSGHNESTISTGHERSRVMWAAGLVVVAGAGVVTAHGLIEVALGATVPEVFAWLYPVITDGLALVAYATTSRLRGAGRKYAWSVVVLAAGLSALAQASFLAAGQTQASEWLRFAVGAWPATAAAIAAHLLFLIGEAGRVGASRDHHALTQRDEPPVFGSERVDLSGTVGDPSGRDVPTGVPAVPAGVPLGVQGVRTGVQVDQLGVQHWDSNTTGVDHERGRAVSQSGRRPGLRPALSPGDRASAMAELHCKRRGEWPSVRELAALADVSRGTAETALRQLREAQPQLHLVDDETDSRSQS